LTVPLFPPIPWNCYETAQSLLPDPVASTNRDGIFEASDIVEVTAMGLGPDGTTPDVPYTYLDQVPTEVYRTPDACDPISSGTDLITHSPTSAIAQIPLSPVRQTAAYITACSKPVGQGDSSTPNIIAQAPDGTVSLFTVVEGLTPVDAGYLSGTAAPIGILLGLTRSYVVDSNWSLRAITKVGTVLTLSATPEEITPDDPDGFGGPIFLRQGTSGQGLWGLKTPSLYTNVFSAVSTVNGG
jgi:hypothetical protein